jgi:P pilus assembly chaperone PapD
MTGAMKLSARLILLFLLVIQPISKANADIVLSQLIVELQPGKHGRDDIEIWNSGTDRAYVALEPREVVNAGLSSETRREEPDPEKLGLLVSPARMILEPGQRKIARIADIAPASDRERIYRVTVKPVAGPLESTDSALKVLIGYDVLVLVRPTELRLDISARRSGNSVVFRNDGNASVELIKGRQCDETRAHCTDLPGKRLYPGAQWSETLQSSGPVDYTIRSPAGSERRSF